MPLLFACVGLFLLVTLLVGLASGRHVKTFEDYAVGRKGFATATLIASVVATLYGGRMLHSNLTFMYKGSMVRMLLPGLIVYWILGSVLSVRMGEFSNHLSIAESMGEVYGKGIRSLMAGFSAIYSMGLLALEFATIYEVATLFMATHKKGAMLIISICVILYATFGGARSVVMTDLLQLAFFGIILPILLIIMAQKLPENKQWAALLYKQIHHDIDQMKASHQAIFQGISTLLVYSIPYMTFPTIQRFYMSAHVWQASKVFNYAGLLTALMKALAAITGICLFAIKPGLTPDEFLPAMVEEYPIIGMHALLCMALIALVMSTADSHLHTSSLMMVHDIIAPHYGTMTSTSKLWLARLMTLLTGALSLYIAIWNPALLYAALHRALTLIGSIISLPCILTILGFRPHVRSVYLAILAGLVTPLCVKTYTNSYTYIAFFSILSSLMFLWGSHYLFPAAGKGWVGIGQKEPILWLRQRRRFQWEAFRNEVTIISKRTYKLLISPFVSVVKKTYSIINAYLGKRL